MEADLLNFIHEDALKLMLDLKGWQYAKNALLLNGLAVVKPDFYPPRHILATGRKGYIYAEGQTRIDYAGQVFASVEDLFTTHGKEAILDFKNWSFLEEKEWVLTDGQTPFIFSFTTLDALPKRTKYRC
tara:strand:+ start:3311 stop:3697 length:387 start_codon:yes stop_codon:yes gene_type:complete